MERLFSIDSPQHHPFQTSCGVSHTGGLQPQSFLVNRRNYSLIKSSFVISLIELGWRPVRMYQDVPYRTLPYQSIHHVVPFIEGNEDIFGYIVIIFNLAHDFCPQISLFLVLWYQYALYSIMHRVPPGPPPPPRVNKLIFIQ